MNNKLAYRELEKRIDNNMYLFMFILGIPAALFCAGISTSNLISTAIGFLLIIIVLIIGYKRAVFIRNKYFKYIKD